MTCPLDPPSDILGAVLYPIDSDYQGGIASKSYWELRLGNPGLTVTDDSQHRCSNTPISICVLPPSHGMVFLISKKKHTRHDGRVGIPSFFDNTTIIHFLYSVSETLSRLTAFGYRSFSINISHMVEELYGDRSGLREQS